MIGTHSQFPSFESLESFLNHFKHYKFDLNSSFKQDFLDVNDLHRFILNYSSPSQVDSLPFLKSALILLLLHPAVRQKSTKLTIKLPPVRTILLQVIGRCVRRANRAQIKTLPITVPLLLPHLCSTDLFNLIIQDLHSDLSDRFHKLKERTKLYNDPITANLLIVFDYFYLINESFHSISYDGRIQPSSFYHQFPDDFDTCEDYAYWRELSEIPDRLLPFTFCDFPWIFNLDLKRKLLMASNGLKQRHHLQDAFFRAIFDGVQSTCLHLVIKRNSLIQDARDQILNKPCHQLSKQLRITFVGEEGVDEGGLKKEFFQLCFNELFTKNNVSGEQGGEGQEGHENSNNSNNNRSRTLKDTFKEIENYLFWFNDKIQEEDENSHQDYIFIGILLALAIYNGVLIAPRFPLLLFKKLLNFPLQLDDYSEIDSLMVKSVNQLVHHDIEGLFHVVPGREEVELIPSGSNIPVTPENKFNFINRLTDHFLNDSISWQFSAFRTGFEMISCDSVIYGFRPDELSSLAYGTDEFNIFDLEGITLYEGGYNEKSKQIIWLWTVLIQNFNYKEQAEFLFFVTGSARAPLGGLSQLNSFTITKVSGDSDRLPSAHTCFNVLLLPEYSTITKLEIKLRLAIKHNKGFGLI